MSRLPARIRYFVTDAWDEWRHSPGVNLLATVTLAAVLFIAGSVVLVVRNVEGRVEAWRNDVRVAVYLEDSISDEAREGVARRLAAAPGVSAVAFVTKEEALRRFRGSFGGLADLASEIGVNPLPASFDAYLAPGPDAARAARELAASLRGVEGIEDVRFDLEWLDRLDAILGMVRAAGAAGVALVLAAVVFVMASVIRLAVYARRDEIEIMLLVGASPALVRGPFLVSGVAQGLLASAASIGLVEGARRALLEYAGNRPGGLLDLLLGRPMPAESAVLVVGLGVLVGMTSAAVAVRDVSRLPA